MRELKLAILFIVGVVAIAACSHNAANNSTSINGNKAAGNATQPGNAATPEVAKADVAEQLYADNCMICHKQKGNGGPVTVQGKKLKAADLTTDRRKKEGDDEFVKDISEGVPDEGMPAFKDKLKPGEIKEIVSYIRRLQN